MDKDGHIFMGMAEAHSPVLWDPVQTQCRLRVSIVVTHPAPQLTNEINSIELMSVDTHMVKIIYICEQVTPHYSLFCRSPLLLKRLVC